MFATFACLVVASAPAGFGWAEGEAPGRANVELARWTTNFPQLLSEGAWATASLRPDQVPGGAIELAYDLALDQAGPKKLWARIGYEWVRSSFDWRLNGGPWTTASRETPTRDVTRLATWVEVAWLDLGTVEAQAGTNTLEIRIHDLADRQEFLFAADAFCLAPEDWLPSGKWQPGSGYDDAIDRAAAQQVFRLPARSGAARAELRLDGPWQVARWEDPNPDASPLEPEEALPDLAGLGWMGQNVPQFDNGREELEFGHRRIYRTRVAVPEGEGGYRLRFGGTNLVASVFVNGQFAGWRRSVLVPWNLDISRLVRPGEENEIAVVVKGPYYAFDLTQPGASLLRNRNLPREQDFIRYGRFVQPIYPSTKGEGDGTAAGLVNPVILEAAGPVYSSKVFANPDVEGRTLGGHVEILNTGPEGNFTLRAEVVHQGTGQVEGTQEKEAFVPVGGLAIPLAVAVPEPKLWWPVPNPELYTLRVTVLQNGQPIDVAEQEFGFREITTDGIKIRINGVARNFWNWVEVSGNPPTPEDFLETFRAEGNRFYRISHDHRIARYFPWRVEQLEFMDRNGIPGRLSTTIDGMFINYDLRNPQVWAGITEHLQQVAEAYRNHPSVVVYSAENELLYINGQNIYGGEMDQIEDQMYAAIEAARRFDDSKPYMVDGGGALVGDRLPIHCPHYYEAPLDYFPSNAFTLERIANHSSRWPWNRNVPMIVGEAFFYAGKLEDQAWIGGDDVFKGRDFANLGASAYTQLLVEGYRWAGAAGICPWVALERIPGAERSYSDLLVVPRRQAFRFETGTTTAVELGAFNDGWSFGPLTLTWSLQAAETAFAYGEEVLNIEPGFSAFPVLSLSVPADAPTGTAQLVLSLSQDGEERYRHQYDVHLTAPVAVAPTGLPLYTYRASEAVAAMLPAAQALTSLANLPPAPALLVVGEHALTAEDAYSTRLVEWASAGGRVVVLEQEVPLGGSGLPAPVRSSTRFGGYAFPQAVGHPALAELGKRDLIDWAGAPPTYESAYFKPTSGARSLVECNEGLRYSALLECPVGLGVIYACQLRVGTALTEEPAARILLRNLVHAADTFAAATGQAAVVGQPGPINDTGAAVTPASLEEALDPARFRVAAVEATAENLAALNGPLSSRREAFLEAGGWILLSGVSPATVEAFSDLVGFQERIRPFRLERVTKGDATLPVGDFLGNRDFTFYGAQELMFGDRFLSERVYSHVLGADDVAPFTLVPGATDAESYTPTFSDNDPWNLVNGLLNSDAWQYIRQLWIGPDGTGDPLVFQFQRPETLRALQIWNNNNYSLAREVELIVDGDPATRRTIRLNPNPTVLEVPLDPPLRVERSLSLEVVSYEGEFIVRDGQELRLVGLDNVKFLRVPEPGEPEQRVPLDSVGGLVAYPRGTGGILACQLRWDREDPNPENLPKKVRVLATLLKNLGVASGGVQLVLPGAGLTFEPIDLTRFANRQMAGPGAWFGDGRDLSTLQAGRRLYGEVEFFVSDYKEAPLPEVLMLGSMSGPSEIQGLPKTGPAIPVERRADALFFLHAVQVNWQPNAEDRQRGVELWRYVVRYADGTSAEVPVFLGDRVEHWLQREPATLPNARPAWIGTMPWGDEKGVLYETQWTNPRPEVEIRSIEMVLAPDGERCTPALLAVSLGVKR